MLSRPIIDTYPFIALRVGAADNAPTMFRHTTIARYLKGSECIHVANDSDNTFRVFESLPDLEEGLRECQQLQEFGLFEMDDTPPTENPPTKRKA